MLVRLSPPGLDHPPTFMSIFQSSTKSQKEGGTHSTKLTNSECSNRDNCILDNRAEFGELLANNLAPDGADSYTRSFINQSPAINGNERENQIDAQSHKSQGQHSHNSQNQQFVATHRANLNSYSINNELKHILNEIKKITDHIEEKEGEHEMEDEWKFAAMVLDRLCLYVFSTALLLGMFLTLGTAPGFISVN